MSQKCTLILTSAEIMINRLIKQTQVTLFEQNHQTLPALKQTRHLVMSSGM